MSETDTENSPVDLSRFRPLDRLSDHDRALLQACITVRRAHTGQRLVSLGSNDPYVLYLLEGSLRLRSEEGREIMVAADSEPGRDPVSKLLPHHYDVSCVQDCRYFRVNHRVLTYAAERGEGVSEAQQVLAAGLPDTDLFRHICQALRADTLSLKMTPGVIQHLLRVCADEERFEFLPMNVLGHIFATDPALAAWLLRAANGPIVSAEGEACRTLTGALMGIGLLETRSWFLGTLQTMQLSPASAMGRQLQQQYWNHSTEVAAISYMLARDCCAGIDPDEAYLAGLLHDLGMLPVIDYVDARPDQYADPSQVAQIIRDYHGRLGAILIKAWGLPATYAEVAVAADHWLRDPGPDPDLADVVMVAQLHSFIGKKPGAEIPPVDAARLPRIDEVPAFAKLGFSREDPRHSLEIINQSHAFFSKIKKFAEQ